MKLKEFQETMKRLYGLLTTVSGRQIDSVGVLDERSYQFRYIAGCIPVSCYAEINPELNVFLVRGIYGLPYEPSRRAVAAEYITRINYPMPIGNWALDYESGDVRFKLGLCFGHEPLTAHIMLTHIDAACWFMDQHIMGFVKLSNGGTLEDALQSALEQNDGANAE